LVILLLKGQEGKEDKEREIIDPKGDPISKGTPNKFI